MPTRQPKRTSPAARVRPKAKLRSNAKAKAKGARRAPRARAVGGVDTIASQIIVGFDTRKMSALGVESAAVQIKSTLARLEEKLPAKVLRSYIGNLPVKEPVVAAALIRLDDPRMTLGDLRRLRAEFPGVAYFERNAPVTLCGFDDPLAGQQWALTKLGVTEDWRVTPPAWPATPPDLLTVAIVDSGLRRADGSLPEDIGTVLPLNVCQPTGTPYVDGVDRDGHGTLLAGTIAAVPDKLPNPVFGIASPIPASWGISLMPIKFFSPETPPSMYDASVAILHALTKGARIINASWHVALARGDKELLREAMDVARQADCLVVAAAGNDGTNNDIYPTYPANFRGLTVLSVMATGRDDSKAGFSNYGPTKVDIAAPGVRILTTGRTLAAGLPPRYPSYSGTSASAAFVSSGAALLLALNPDWKFREIREHLLASADTIEGLKIACIDGKRLNLRRAVYGPLRVTAPAEGDTVVARQTTAITWANDYTNGRFTKVKIEFSEDDGLNWRGLDNNADNAFPNGTFNWTPRNTDRTQSGRIRITPKRGNFPAISGRFQVV